MPRGLYTADNAGLAFSPDGSQFAFMAGTNALLIDVRSGARVWGWKLPPGRVDELAFDPSGRLFCFHFESADGAAPVLSRPRAARIRELVRGGGTADLRELREFNWDVRGATWSQDGSFIVIEGTQVENSLTNRFVEAVRPSGDKPLWAQRVNLRPGVSARSVLDSAGRFIAFVPGPLEPVPRCFLLEAESGKTNRELPSPPRALNSSARRWFGPRNPSCDVMSLNSLEDDSLLAFVQPSEPRSSSIHEVFSCDGRFLAWGNENGTVSVCDLEEMAQRLGRLKLGW
jgi:WD40 repeat protein